MEKMILYALLLFFAAIFAKNLFSYIFGLDNYKLIKEREKQLNFGEQKKDINEKIEILSSPVSKYIIPKMKIHEAELAQNLVMIGWDKKFTPKSYMALNITLKIIAVALAILFSFINILIGIIIGSVVFVLLDVYVNAEVNDRKAKVLEEFPTFLRITQGFLASDRPLVISMEDTLPYLSPEWQKLIADFIANYNYAGIKVALNKLKDATGLFEVRKFVALLNLAIDQNIDVKEGFNMQADAIIEMQQLTNARKLNRRKNLSILIQAPMMIAIILAFGLPIVGDMKALGLF